MTEGYRFRPEGTEHRGGRVLAVSMRAVGSLMVPEGGAMGGVASLQGRTFMEHRTPAGLLGSQAGRGARARDR